MVIRQRLLVISADYPDPEYIYGDTFVHTRLKKYLNFFDVKVVGYNSSLKERREFTYENINVSITPSLAEFRRHVTDFDPDVIAIHLIQHQYMDFLIQLQKPLVVFVHGYEATGWYRRWYNYNSLGALRYLWDYAYYNTLQLRKLRKFVKQVNENSRVQFVFVSEWLKKAAQKDLRLKIKHANVIPNPIDTTVFSFKEKTPELRKKILLLRSFKARNYANDIAIDAVLKLSKKPFFNELEICIQGQGYLFGPLTKRIENFQNVTLKNYFVENKEIPSIHGRYGIFLAPSRMDTQGVSMCEAMASGLVPITSAIGGIPEYCKDGESGFLIKTADDIVEKIEYLYHNPDAFLLLSKQSRNSILQTCSDTKIIPKEVKLLRSAIGGSADNTLTVDYKQCTRCLMDTNDDPEIVFDDEQVCSYCRHYEIDERQFVKKGDEGRKALEDIVNEIKKAGQGKPYDCILGLSGGVDSSYLALQAKKFGLRPLAVHLDNGWNSELAVGNIENIVTRLGFSLYTVVIDWEEFRDLQLAFLKASVVDIEMITDHAIIASLYKLAVKHDIKFILSGTNVVTESVLPKHWIHRKGDHVHIRAINKSFGNKPFKTYPLLNLSLRIRADLKTIRSVSVLNYLPYNKAKAKEEIVKEFDWRDYGGKHYESIFTRFYQGYILPHKFGIDKRKAHVSNLICSGQLTRQEGIDEISKSGYDKNTYQTDREFVLKKLNLSEADFARIMRLPIKKHTDYPVEDMVYERFPILKIIGPIWRLFKKVNKV